MTLLPSLRNLLRELAPHGEIDDDDDLLAVGAIASMQLMELINQLEDRYAVTVEQRDLTAGRLRSLATIAALIRERGRAS